MNTKLEIYQKFYDLILYMYPIIKKMPKSERHTLSQHIRNSLIDIARMIVEANKRKNKVPTLKSITDKDGVVHTGYIVCMRITVITVEGPVAPPQVNCLSRAFGDANTDGVQMYTATTIKAMNISRIGMSSSASMTLQLLNMSTGLGSSFTIPANATSLNADITDLAFSVNNKLGLAHQSGTGTLQDMEVIFQ